MARKGLRPLSRESLLPEPPPAHHGAAVSSDVVYAIRASIWVIEHAILRGKPPVFLDLATLAEALRATFGQSGDVPKPCGYSIKMAVSGIPRGSSRESSWIPGGNSVQRLRICHQGVH